MEDLSKNGFLKQNPHLNFQPPTNNEMKRMYRECGSSSGMNSSRKPPLPSFRNSSLVDETRVLPINNQNKSNEAEATSTNNTLGRRLSSMTAQELIDLQQKTGRKIDPATIDVKKLKRTIANRFSAQRYRMKKTQEIDEMENKVRELEETINATKIQLESIRKNKQVSRALNIVMKEKLDYLTKKSILNEMEIDWNRAEKNRLNNYYLQVVGPSAMNAEEDNRNTAGMGGHGETSNQVSNMKDSIHQSTNPSN